MKKFQADIIVQCIRWHLRYLLTYRDLQEMLLERGIEISHTTIMRWIHQHSPELDKKIRRKLKLTDDSWKLDETYVKFNGKPITILDFI